jgi:acyl-CoA thioesterase-1
MVPDIRACFVGDSFVAGVGDPHHLGWVGRIAARTHHAALTSYNLGVRRDTSDDVLSRWRHECAQRLPAGCTARIVVSFGVNDTFVENGRQRVDPDRSVANLSTLLAQAVQAGWPVLVVGPVPVVDEQRNHRTASLNETLHQFCCRQQTRYVDVFDALRTNPTWMHQVEHGDGAHPSAEGYEAYADRVWPHWSAWIC